MSDDIDIVELLDLQIELQNWAQSRFGYEAYQYDLGMRAAVALQQLIDIIEPKGGA